MNVQVAFNAGKAAQAQTALSQQKAVDNSEDQNQGDLDAMQKNIDSKPPEQKSVFASPGQFGNQFAS